MDLGDDMGGCGSKISSGTASTVSMHDSASVSGDMDTKSNVDFAPHLSFYSPRLSGHGRSSGNLVVKSGQTVTWGDPSYRGGYRDWTACYVDNQKSVVIEPGATVNIVGNLVIRVDAVSTVTEVSSAVLTVTDPAFVICPGATINIAKDVVFKIYAAAGAVSINSFINHNNDSTEAQNFQVVGSIDCPVIDLRNLYDTTQADGGHMPMLVTAANAQVLPPEKGNIYGGIVCKRFGWDNYTEDSVTGDSSSILRIHYDEELRRTGPVGQTVYGAVRHYNLPVKLEWVRVVD